MGQKIGMIRRFVLTANEVQDCVVFHSVNPPATMDVERFVNNGCDLVQPKGIQYISMSLGKANYPVYILLQGRYSIILSLSFMR